VLTLFGFVVGVALVVYGISTGKAPPDIFLNYQGMAIVFGGTIAAVVVSYPVPEILRAFTSYFIIFRSGSHKYVKAVDEMVSYIRACQRDGLEKLCELLKSGTKLWIFYDGVQMMSVGYAKEETKEVLEDQVRWQMAREMKQHHLFATMAKVAPAFGMIGTLIGLINMLITLQNQPGKVGIGLAIALTTTFYGLILANLVFAPISEKLKERAENNLLIETMQVEAVMMLYDKRNYIFARDKLAAYLSAGQRKRVQRVAGKRDFSSGKKRFRKVA